MKKTLVRCSWSMNIPLMTKYHDKEWGVPVYNDQKLFEFLVLESAQAGLSWLTILRKRKKYRKAFANFYPKKVAKFSKKDVTRLLRDPGIIRNRLKIEATIQNAKCFLEIQKEFGSFSKYMWGFVGGKPMNGRRRTHKNMPAKTVESEIFSKDLKSRGFKFLGPTTSYAYMQAIGMVNDHVKNCFRYEEIMSGK